MTSENLNKLKDQQNKTMQELTDYQVNEMYCRILFKLLYALFICLFAFLLMKSFVIVVSIEIVSLFIYKMNTFLFQPCQFFEIFTWIFLMIHIEIMKYIVKLFIVLIIKF